MRFTIVNKSKNVSVKCLVYPTLLKNKKVNLIDVRRYKIINTKVFRIDVNVDYEIFFEAGEDWAGGINLEVLHDFYVFQILKEFV